jgi:UPF0755 protein
MNRTRSCSTLIFFFTILFGLIAMILLIVAWGKFEQVDPVFGAPSPNLGFSERLSYTWQLVGHTDTLTRPADPLGQDVEFVIQLGESPIVISERLQQAGLIEDADAFRVFLVYKGLDTQIQAGKYTLNPAQAPIEIAEALVDPAPTNATLVILAGWRLEEIAASLPTSGLGIAPDDFIALVQSEAAEGYLMPGMYDLPRTTSAEAMLWSVRSAFDAAISDEILDGFEQQGLNLQQAIILASIVEREAVVADEMPLIASVFINRLVVGMKLESDPTVQYAVGFNASQNSWWTNPISLADLQFDSPYNTYIYPGLPPGPICNPSLNALRAVAFPAQSPYYFFRATCDGSGRHAFAETFQEHVNNACP